jgi:glycerophosphoryl diester phosphodiesterase
MLVHAKDEAAQAFYRHFGFESFPEEPLTLYRLLRDTRLIKTYPETELPVSTHAEASVWFRLQRDPGIKPFSCPAAFVPKGAARLEG